MVGIFQRNKIIFIIVAVLLLAVVVWLVILKQSDSKIPMRGVYVLGQPLTRMAGNL